MAAAHLLKAKDVENAKPRTSRYCLNDGNGLQVRVYPDGTKRFYLRYWIDGKERWMLLHANGVDTFPHLSLQEARRLAHAAKASVNDGIDPLASKHAARLEAKVRQAERVQQAAEKLARQTVATLFENWITLDLAKRKDKGAETRRGFEKDVLPEIGDMPAESVTKAHVMAILDKVLARGSNRMAKRFLSELRQMFGFALDREIIAADPTARIKKDKIGGKAMPRDRHLTDEEVKLLAAALPDAELLKVNEAALWIMLATGCRVGEISRARWQDIDFERGTWVLPTDHAKNKRRFVIHLSDFAKEQFRRLEELKSHDEWVFPNRKGTSHIDLKTISKQVHDRQRITPMKGRSAKVGTLVLPGGPWTPHDLRRTAATMMGNLGVQPYVIERCLNHIEQDKMVRVYQHQKLIQEQATAWRLLGEHLQRVLHPDDNVIALPSRAA